MPSVNDCWVRFRTYDLMLMTSKKKIANALIQVLTQEMAMSNNLYAEELADFEAELKASIDKDADDALLWLCCTTRPESTRPQTPDGVMPRPPSRAFPIL